jgi:hypothetical protein
MKRLCTGLGTLALGLAVFFVSRNSVGAGGGKIDLLLPQSRTAFQTNEWIDVSVVRNGTEALPKSDLTLTLTGADGSKITSTFAVPAVAVQGNAARATEHYHLNGWLLRPGKYTVEASADGAAASKEIELVNHVRQSSFRLINWGRADKPAQQMLQGENSFGYNLYYDNFRQGSAAEYIRGGVDAMSNCTMSGGHQMDLRMECDWSDPYVTRGGTARVAKQALSDRTRPNVSGVHFYDEPGLTWMKDAKGEMTPHMLPTQVRSFVAAFGKPPLTPEQLDPKNPEHVRQWSHWARWKLSFMDAAWKEAQFGVSQVRQDYLSLTQSQYGWTAFTDGYYFNVVRSLPITSGHGGYHDIGPGFFCPSFFMEMARARDLSKPCWYLPCWYGNTTSDQFRLEQYLSFQTNIQGMMSPPDMEPAINPLGRDGIVESNQLMKKLGPIFNTMPPNKPPVALLYSLSQAIHSQIQDTKKNYVHELRHGQNLALSYLAGKLLQQQLLPVVDEDVLDGTVASDHKAIVLTSLDYLDPDVVAALESFAEQGGLVILTGDCTVTIKGAVKLAVKPAMPDQAEIDKIMAAKKYDQLGPYTTTGKHIQAALALANAIKPELEKKGITPIFASDVPTISATRQAVGDIEYLFAVNATYDETAKDMKGNPERNAVKATAATLSLAGDGRPVYDAVVGGSVSQLQSKDGKLTGQFRFGPGQMRVFARTARPIAGVKALTPVVTRDLVQEQMPIRVEVGAALVDAKGGVLSGSAPLHVQLIDPLGVVRHELYRATRLGTFSIALPLAANDPAGEWKVVVQELLNNSTDTAAFRYAPPARVRSITGATPRAVYALNDRDNAFRFARLFHDVTIVKGKSTYTDAAAKRLAKILEPWGVRCKEMDLTEASKSRSLTEEEAKTWIGLVHAGSGQIKPGDGNPPILAGFAVRGPVILLGNPDDHPIIKFLNDQKYLPYTPGPAFPGPGRGMIAWQRDGVGHGQESITLIASDEAGMSEAVGSFYETVAGLEPLTKWALPQSDTLTAAKTAPGLAPAATVAWTGQLPDRVLALKARDGGLAALTHDGSLSTVSAEGKVAVGKVLSGIALTEAEKELKPADATATEAVKKQARPDRMLKLAAANGGNVAVAYWGGTLRIVDDQGKVRSEQQLPQDVTALAWLDGKLIAGLADGRVVALAMK